MDLDICMASDDNYAMHLGICIVSIVENNLSNINIHILNNNMSEFNLKKLKSLENDYSNLNIIFYNIHDYFRQTNVEEIIRDELEGTQCYDLLGISTFSRLFLGELLPENIKKVLYLDADIVVLGNLDELFTINLDDVFVGGVIDGLAANANKYFYKGKIKSVPFINAGVLLINLEKWREIDIVKLSLDLIRQYPEKDFLNDQSIINVIGGEDVLLLDPKFNAMSESFYVSYKKNLKLNSYFGPIDDFYSDDQFDNSLKNPVVVHFITQLWDRPWLPHIGIFNHEPKNPFNKCYNYYKDLSPWADIKIQKPNKSIQERVYYEISRVIVMYFPVKLLSWAFYIKNRMKYKAK